MSNEINEEAIRKCYERIRRQLKTMLSQDEKLITVTKEQLYRVVLKNIKDEVTDIFGLLDCDKPMLAGSLARISAFIDLCDDLLHMDDEQKECEEQ